MDAVFSRLQRALSGRYVLDQELGRGGMAVVYLGRDLRLERRVAIKVFDRADDSVAGTERFLREIRIAAQLQHPNILPVFESGEAEGLVFYVMPYIAGATLRERLEREGPLPVNDAVRIAREVAEALDHAHRAGIVHRDIKPDNIMLADGVAVVADFGIARAVEESGAGKLTDTGLALGTPLYMSPEQATASPQIDGRTDIYALGCVLYEMLAGSPPFQGKTGQAVMARHATDGVPPLTTVRQVPPALESVILRALAKLPADRWPTGKALADSLSTAVPTGPSVARTPPMRRGLVLAAVATILVVAGLALWRARGTDSISAAEAPVASVAVLPVRAVGDTGLLKYADGMTEAIINGLMRLEGLRVPGGSRTFAFRDRQSDLRAVGRELGVETVLSGSLQEAGGRLRLSVQLVSVRDGLLQWTSTYDGALANLFAMQDSVTVSLVDKLRLALAPAKRASLVRGARTRDTVAYRLFLEAKRVLKQINKTNTEQSVALLRGALARDSTFSDAWLALAGALDVYKGYATGNQREVDAEIRLATNRAADIDSLNADAIADRAWNKVFYDWDIPGAERDLNRAVTLAPGSAGVLSSYAALLTYMQKPESSLVYARRAFRLDSTAAFSSMWAAYVVAGNLDSAFVWTDRELAFNPSCWPCELGRAEYFRSVGKPADATRAIDAFLRGGGDLAQAVGNAADYYRRAGDRAGALRMEQRLAAITRERPFGANTAKAQIRLALGDRAGAFQAIDDAVRERERLLPMAILMGLESLRGDEHFEAVRAKFYGGRPPPYANARAPR